MESESLIADGAGRAAKTSYNAAPAAAPDSGPKFTRKTIFGDVSLPHTALAARVRTHLARKAGLVVAWMKCS